VIRRKTGRAMLLLAFLAVVTWLGGRGRDEPEIEPFADLDTRLNYALWDFNAQLLDDEGRVQLEMNAPMLRNNASTQVGTVENPRIRIRQEDDEWHISADSAIITPDREHVSLIGHVDFLRQSKLKADRLEIRTRDVMLNVTPQTASTEAAVILAQNHDRLEAKGMKLDMKTNSYELLDEVRGSYAQP